MAKIDILLASFNGEKYIEAQILSLLAQTYKDWRLLIHDDGSSDKTLEIIGYWQAIDSRIHLLSDGIKCGGAANNFMHLLKYSDSDYLMFCDQDDIWFDNKIQVMYDNIIKKDNYIPTVVYANSYVWISQEGIKGLATLTFPANLKAFLFLNSGMQGCVSIFNSVVKDKMLQWKGGCAMHDHLLHLIGLTMGSVEYLPISLMLYRNHESNVTGGTNTSLVNLNRLVDNANMPVVSSQHYEVVRRFVKQFKREISSNDLSILQSYLVLPYKTLIYRIFVICRDQFKLYNSTVLLVFKIILRPYINKLK